jgi:putative peptidoglycan lipid II flippase
MAFNLMLAPFFGYVGLAIATAMSATLNALMLYHGLKKDKVFQLSKSTWWFFIRLIFSAVVMAIVVYNLSPEFKVWLEMSTSIQIQQLLICISFGMLSYFVSLVVLGIRMKDFKVKSDVKKV